MRPSAETAEADRSMPAQANAAIPLLANFHRNRFIVISPTLLFLPVPFYITCRFSCNKERIIFLNF